MWKLPVAFYCKETFNEILMGKLIITFLYLILSTHRDIETVELTGKD